MDSLASKQNQKGTLTYLVGDATAPQLTDGETACIPHSCNNLNKWGSGFVVPLGQRFPQARKSYHSLFLEAGVVPLGTVQEIAVAGNVLVYNMVAQNGLISKSNQHPLSYQALRICLATVTKLIRKQQAQNPDVKYSVHCPRIGAGLGGGNWTHIVEIFNQTLLASGIDVFVYDLPKR